MKIETFDDPKQFLEALHGGRQKRAVRNPTRPKRSTQENSAQQATGGILRVRSERTGLSTLLLAGWNTEGDAAMRTRLWRGALDTGWHDDEKDACDRAKELERCTKP